jgi:hypothetical protein
LVFDESFLIILCIKYLNSKKGKLFDLSARLFDVAYGSVHYHLLCMGTTKNLVFNESENIFIEKLTNYQNKSNDEIQIIGY